MPWPRALAALFWIALASGRALAQDDRAALDDHVALGEPVPAWVVPLELVEPREGAGGIETLAHDLQWRIEDGRSVRFARIALRIRSTTGLDEISELSIGVGSDEALALHHVRRTRDGRTADILTRESVRVIQPESRRDHGVYDESRSALVFLDDLRVGDVIEYAYSRTLDDAITGGRVAYREQLGAYATRVMRFVASWPAGRPVATRVHGAPDAWRVARTDTSIRIDATDVEPPEVPDDAPDWFHRRAWIQLTEFPDWRAVVAWALPHYTVEDPSAALREVPMERFRAAPTEGGRAVLALRFVQDEVRYLGLEMGERALVPHPPELVARRRYGDCKDKSLLLATILRALGIEADVALVHSERGHLLDGELPGPGAFDHVVVRARVGGEHVWMDPTRTHERGPIDALPPLLVGRALLLRSDADGLVEVPVRAATAPTVDVEERYTVEGQQATLHVVTTMRGRDASSMRAQLEEIGREEMQARFLRFYEGLDLAPVVATPLEVEELPDGALRWREHYRARTFWGAGDHDVSPWAVAELLQVPEPDRGIAPVRVPYPADVRHRSIVELREGWDIDDEHERIDAEAFALTHDVRVEGTRLTLTVEMRTHAGHVTPDRVAAYAADVERARDLIGDAVTAPGSVTPEAWREATLWSAGAVAAVALAIVLGAVGLRIAQGRRRRRFRRKQRFEAGESAAHAIPVAGRDEAEHAQANVTCCGLALPGEWSRAQLAGSALFVHAGRCERCGTATRRYYRQA